MIRNIDRFVDGCCVFFICCRCVWMSVWMCFNSCWVLLSFSMCFREFVWLLCICLWNGGLLMDLEGSPHRPRTFRVLAMCFCMLQKNTERIRHNIQNTCKTLNQQMLEKHETAFETLVTNKQPAETHYNCYNKM